MSDRLRARWCPCDQASCVFGRRRGAATGERREGETRVWGGVRAESGYALEQPGDSPL